MALCTSIIQMEESIKNMVRTITKVTSDIVERRFRLARRDQRQSLIKLIRQGSQ